MIYIVLSVEPPSTMMYSISKLPFWLKTLSIVSSIYFSELKQGVIMDIFTQDNLIEMGTEASL
jgi:hypothetical protein